MTLFRTRRSLKPAGMDPDREVPRALVEDVLADACWAPTHGLTQPWRFQVFAAAAARERLATGLQALYDTVTPEGKVEAEKRAKLAFGPRRARVVVAVAARVEPGGRIPEWEEMAATACAVQNLLLSAHTHGLGSFWSTPPVACGAAFGRWLGLDETHRPLGLIYLGWPLAGLAEPVSTRVPPEARVTWHEA